MAARKRTRRAPRVKTPPEKAVVHRSLDGDDKCRTSRRTPPKPDFDTILGRLSDSLSIIATATSALANAQHVEGSVTATDSGDEIVTLEHGVDALRSAYNEMDVAIREVRT